MITTYSGKIGALITLTLDCACIIFGTYLCNKVEVIENNSSLSCSQVKSLREKVTTVLTTQIFTLL